MIGMATVANDYPLYYEATNEWGLSIAGLHFPDNAHYFPVMPEKDNIAPFELIPWILAQCKTLAEARILLVRLNLCAIDFSESLPLSPLHWVLADRDGAVTVESTVSGLKIHDNPIGVLTNNPTFDYHMTHLCHYRNLTPLPSENHFQASSTAIDLPPYSRGLGAVGLPGDLSSASRFVRAAFFKLNSVSESSENSSVSQFFHILGTVSKPRGSVRLPDGSFDITVYTCCINTEKGIYYYTTYENQCICAVDMHHCDLELDTISVFQLQNTLFTVSG